MTRESIRRGVEQAARGEGVQRDDLLAPSLTEFLLARIDDDQFSVTPHRPGCVYLNDRRVCDCWFPAWWLAEIAAKRRIVEAMGDDWVTRTLASVYADHPDYREEWR